MHKEDAFHLSQSLPMIEQFPLSSTQGASGQLFLLKDRTIWRNMSMSFFKNGLAKIEEKQ